eukprot:6482992-Amphidinium_carterae.2
MSATWIARSRSCRCARICHHITFLSSANLPLLWVRGEIKLHQPIGWKHYKKHKLLQHFSTMRSAGSTKQ